MKVLLAVSAALLLLTLAMGAGICTTIGEAKLLPDGTIVTVEGSVTWSIAGECYIESTDRSNAILVRGSFDPISAGQKVSVTGALGVVDGERLLDSAAVVPVEGQMVIKPLGLASVIKVGGKCEGGGASLQNFKPGPLTGPRPKPEDGTWSSTVGLSNTGSLVRASGIVNAVYYSPSTDAHWFYMDDNNGAVSDCGDKGILVYSDAAVKEDNYVTVTGTSSVEISKDDPQRLIRVLRARSADDVQVLIQDAVNIYPFSDEFDRSDLDGNWIRGSHKGGLSVTSNPGWLTLSTTTTLTESASVKQKVPRTWDMVMKVRFGLDSAPHTIRQYIMLDSNPVVDICCYSQVPFMGSSSFYATLGGKEMGQMNGDTCYIRLRMRRPTLYCSVSTDGTNYSAEVRVQSDPTWMELYAATSWNKGVPYTSLIDYIRFTQVGW